MKKYFLVFCLILMTLAVCNAGWNPFRSPLESVEIAAEAYKHCQIEQVPNGTCRKQQIALEKAILECRKKKGMNSKDGLQRIEAAIKIGYINAQAK